MRRPMTFAEAEAYYKRRLSDLSRGGTTLPEQPQPQGAVRLVSEDGLRGSATGMNLPQGPEMGPEDIYADEGPQRYRSQPQDCYVTCSRCGKQVSNRVTSALPEGIVVRAWVECPECVPKPQPQDAALRESIAKELWEWEGRYGGHHGRLWKQLSNAEKEVYRSEVIFIFKELFEAAGYRRCEKREWPVIMENPCNTCLSWRDNHCNIPSVCWKLAKWRGMVDQQDTDMQHCPAQIHRY